MSLVYAVENAAKSLISGHNLENPRTLDFTIHPLTVQKHLRARLHTLIRLKLKITATFFVVFSQGLTDLKSLMMSSDETPKYCMSEPYSQMISSTSIMS